MKHSIKDIIIGVVIGIVLFGSFSVIADNLYNITENPYTITVNGVKKAIQGYNINDSSYFRLRDIGEQVGFDVDFKDNTILIATRGSYDMQTDNSNAEPTLAYEIINGIEYISAKNATLYFDEAQIFPQWNLAISGTKPTPSEWCYLCHMGGSYGEEVLEEYEINSVVIDNVQYITREVFERDVLGRINVK